MRPALALLAALLAATPAGAAPRPVVVELFTSQACSSCPPADALLRRLAAADPGLLALDLHVTYWNGAAYRDPYALAAATARQNWYAGLRGAREVYTPEAVVDGHTRLVGSDAPALRAAIARARGQRGIAVAVAATPRRVTVRLPAGAGAGQVVLFGYDPAHTTHVGGGENAGATLTEIDVVRSITPLGRWHGTPRALSLRRPAGARFAVLVQRDDGTVLGVGRQATPPEAR
ncbi:MAG: DUF1223 domain-containing protein [Acetobacteraceae bacterium]